MIRAKPGKTNSTRMVDTTSPPITVSAIGAHSDPDPLPSKTIGTNPRTVVNVVIMIGRTRSNPAAISALYLF